MCSPLHRNERCEPRRLHIGPTCLLRIADGRQRVEDAALLGGVQRCSRLYLEGELPVGLAHADANLAPAAAVASLDAWPDRLDERFHAAWRATQRVRDVKTAPWPRCRRRFRRRFLGGRRNGRAFWRRCCGHRRRRRCVRGVGWGWRSARNTANRRTQDETRCYGRVHGWPCLQSPFPASACARAHASRASSERMPPRG